MAIGRRAAVDRRLQTLWTVGIAGDADDRTLLSRYALSRDDGSEEAFRVLVERHGPMVLRVCRQVIGDLQAAEEATQAVFLILARKAGSIRVEGTVAPWLHGVARRVAAKAKGRAAARRRAETRAAAVAASLRDADGDKGPGVEDWEVIHQEVDRLPEKYRTPVVLCYLQGQTYEQAARRIGCPVGTVRVRLSRARERLQSRLTRRGLGPGPVAAVGWFANGTGGGLPTISTAVADWVPVGASRIEATVGAARALGTSRAGMAGMVPASVFELYEGGVRAMMINRWMTAAAWLLAAGMMGAGVIGFAGVGAGGQEKAAPPGDRRPAAEATRRKASEPPIDFDSPETLRKQTERRVNAARQRIDAQRAYYEEGRITIGRFIDASRKLMLAEIAANSSREQRVAAIKAHWDRIAEVQRREQDELEKGKGNVADLSEAVVAYENAAFDYISARQSQGSADAETLKRRVEALEKQVDPNSPETLHKQTERRVNAARQRIAAQRAYYREGRITIDRYIDASEQLMRAEMAASTTKDERLAAAKANMARIEEILELEQAELEKGQGTVADVAEAAVARENAACTYLEVRQERGPYELEILTKRVEALEKQLESPRKPSEPPGTDRK
jgi:RNA polymerase sigma factor (sigma-70 family)